MKNVNIQTEISKLDRPEVAAKKGYLLPYQVEWAYDESRFTACEKSVRVGITYAQEFKVVRERQIKGKGDYLHSSVTQGVALNFIRECQFWIDLYKIKASSIGETEYYDELTKTQERALYIEFTNKQRIVSFSSSPNNMRGFGGAVGLDEIAFHRKMREMMKGAGSRSLWGDPVSMWSSHNGAESEWNMFLQRERALGDKSKWSIHRVTILNAIDQGLVEKINEVKKTNFTRQGFLEDCKAAVGSQEAFEEECLCIAQDRGDPAVSWYDIQNASKDYRIVSIDVSGDAREGDDIDPSVAALIRDNPFGGLDPRKRYSFGYDVARTGHLSSVWVNETDGKNHRLVLHIKLHKCKFSSQRELLVLGLDTLKGMSGSGDSTGLGMQTCEELHDRYRERFTPVNFGAFKPYLGGKLRGAFEDGRQIIPREPEEIAYDIRALKTAQVGTKVSFTESKNPVNPLSHCDIAWSDALAITDAEDGENLGPCRMAPAGTSPDYESGDRSNWMRPNRDADLMQAAETAMPY
ncbi:MAG: hypothetical protein PHH77_05300 [Victivallaceae bacterium]|nr:hypothetical protein [Victivallaceae bacterium]